MSDKVTSKDIVLAHSAVSAELGSKEGLLALGAFAALAAYGRSKVTTPMDVARVCRVDIRTAKRLWPVIKPLMAA